MANPLGHSTTLGVACLGVTHPHTSGRVRAVQRRTDFRMLGAADDSPLLQPFCEALGLAARLEGEYPPGPGRPGRLRPLEELRHGRSVDRGPRGRQGRPLREAGGPERGPCPADRGSGRAHRWLAPGRLLLAVLARGRGDAGGAH